MRRRTLSPINLLVICPSFSTSQIGVAASVAWYVKGVKSDCWVEVKEATVIFNVLSGGSERQKSCSKRPHNLIFSVAWHVTFTQVTRDNDQQHPSAALTMLHRLQ